MKYILALLVVCALILGSANGLVGVLDEHSLDEQIKDMPSEIKVAQINQKIDVQGGNWTAAENDITRMSSIDRQKLLGYIPSSYRSFESSILSIDTTSTPSSFDWRSVNGSNWLTPVRNQGSCGSCWAFAAVGVSESRAKIAMNNSSYNPDWAEQDLVSCYSGTGCGGGYHSEGLMYEKDVGIVDESCFPYTQTNNNCANVCSNWPDRLFKILSFSYLQNTDADIKAAISTYGPVTVYMAVYSDFYAYSSGIYTNTGGTLDGYHSVDIVGYNDSGHYWIVRNSWGSTWGDGGYFKIAYSENVYSFSSWYYSSPRVGTFFLDDSESVTSTDSDMDGIADEIDNCPLLNSTNQVNTDGDRYGNVCDLDDDNDGVLDVNDACPLVWGNGPDGCIAGDSVAPSINSITLSDYNIRNGTSVIVNVNATDDSGIKNVTAEGMLLARYGTTNMWNGSISLSSSPLDVVVYDNAGLKTTNSSVTYIIDNTAPVISNVNISKNYAKTGDTINITFNYSESYPNNSWVLVGSKNATKLHSDSVSMVYGYTADGAENQGLNVINITVVDEAGNMGHATKNVTFDFTAPVITNVDATNNVIHTDGVLLLWVNATEVNFANLSVDGRQLSCTGTSPAVNCIDYFSPTYTHFMQIEMYDLAGNKANASYKVTIDDELPIVYAPSINETGEITVDTRINFSANATDNVGIDMVSVGNANLPYGINIVLQNADGDDMWTVSHYLRSLGIKDSDGVAYLTFKARDRAYNENTTNLTVIMDKTNPSLSSASANKNYVRSDQPINLTVQSSDRSLFSVTLNGTEMNGNISSGGTFYTVNTTSQFGCSGGEGSCTLQFLAKDKVNLTNTTYLTISYDDLAPRVSNLLINDTDNIVSQNQAIKLIALVIDPNVTSVKIGSNFLSNTGTVYIIYSTPKLLGCISNSICTLTITAVDGAGNINDTESLQITVDDNLPVVSLLSPANNSWINTTNPNLLFKFADSNYSSANCTLYSNGHSHSQSVSNNSQILYDVSSFGFENDKIYSWNVTCVNQVGNAGISPTWIFRTDTSAPTTTYSLNVTPNSNGWINTIVDITLASTDSGSGVNKTQFTVGGGYAWFDYITEHFFVSARLPEDKFYFKSIDNAGNVESVNSFDLKYDSVSPVLNSISVNDSEVDAQAPFVLTTTASDADSGVENVNFTILGTPIHGELALSSGAYNATVIAPSLNGIYNVSVKAYDLAGNLATDSRLQIEVNGNAPQIFTDILNGSYLINNSPLIVRVENADSATIWHTGLASAVAITPEQNVTVPISGDNGPFYITLNVTNGGMNLVDGYTYMIDSAAPLILITSPISNMSEVSSLYMLNASVTDTGSGVNNVSFYVDSTLVGWDDSAPYSALVDTSNVTDGLHQLNVHSDDRLGNANSEIYTINVTNNKLVTIDPDGNSTLSANNFAGTPLFTVIDSVVGINGSINFTAQILPGAGGILSSQISTLINRIDMNTSTAPSATVYFLISKQILDELGLFSPYSSISVYADHGTGVTGPLTAGYVDEVYRLGVAYERFFFNTSTFSTFYWGVKGNDSSGGGSGNVTIRTSSGGGGGYVPEPENIINITTEGSSLVFARYSAARIVLPSGLNDTLRVGNISNNSVAIIFGNGQEFLFSLGEIKDIDIDGDGMADMEVVLKVLNSTHATLFVNAIAFESSPVENNSTGLLASEGAPVPLSSEESGALNPITGRVIGTSGTGNVSDTFVLWGFAAIAVASSAFIVIRIRKQIEFIKKEIRRK